MIGKELKSKSELTFTDKIIIRKSNDQKITAISFYERAAKLGFVDSILRLGSPYVLMNNKDKVAYLLYKASSHGSVEAKKALKCLRLASLF